MATEFKLPELGENIESGNVTKVLVAPGDEVAKDQPVLEIETDKAVLEVPSTVAGTVAEVRAQEGQRIRVGDTVLVLRDGAAAAPAEAPAETAEKAPPAPEKKSVAARRAPAEAPAPKGKRAPASVEPGEVEAAGDVEEQIQEEPSTTAIQPGADKAAAKKDGKEEPAAEQAAPTREASGAEAAPSAAPAMARAGGGPAPASPSVRRLAREIGVDINQVPGSDPSGRITIEDVKNYARQMNTDVGGALHRPHAGPHVPMEPLPDFTRWGDVDREEMSSVRRRTAEHMAHAWATVPHVTQFDKADITELEKLRKQFGPRIEAAGGKLTVTAILAKVVAHALQKFPQFNASIDVPNNQLIYKRYYNMGIAVDTERGLLVPVIRDVDRKNVTEIAVEITELAEKARNRKATLEEMQGGTFTITNLGGIGGTSFTPIVNSPEVAILGVARAQTEPVWINNQFQPRSMLPLALSYDHRVIDGADGARFLRWIVEALEQPFLMFLEG